MAIELRHRRGTVAENNAFTGAAAEVTVDTTNNRLRVHDGVIVGGFVVGSDYVNVLDYGAHPSFTASQNAIAIQNAFNENSNIIFPINQIFQVDAELTVNNCNINLNGSTIQFTSDATNGLKCLKGTSSFKHTKIENGVIDATSITTVNSAALEVSKGDYWMFEELYIKHNTSTSGAKVVKVEPFEDYAWIENLYFKNVKLSGGEYGWYFKVPNYLGTFINQCKFENCETRGSVVNAVYGDLTETTASAQKLSAYQWDVCEFDGRNTNVASDLMYFVGSGGVAKVESWIFNACGVEDFATNHSSNYVINSDVAGLITGLHLLGCTRYNFGYMFDTSKVTEAISTLDSSTPDIFNLSIQSDSISSSTISSSRINSATEVNTSKETSASYYSAGQTKGIASLNNNYETKLIIANRTYGAAWGACLITRGDSSSNVTLMVLSSNNVTFALSGTTLNLTNDSGAGTGIHVTSLTMQTSV